MHYLLGLLAVIYFIAVLLVVISSYIALFVMLGLNLYEKYTQPKSRLQGDRRRN